MTMPSWLDELLWGLAIVAAGGVAAVIYRCLNLS